ncbi:tRNA (adenine(22)-N(1))-methyltransferase TrmK [Candidatus Phytoplasma oryzae]|nr:tRNA (adenine(22)-N(1))-methyltransferase TrmK [Candidatus Phytoplasma oryzae]
MKRIDFIVNILKGYNIVLDIGTDHGLILKKAFDLKYIKRAIATDIKIKPLTNAKKKLSNYPVDFYLSDGFNKIYDIDFDLALICGMGAYSIINILNKTFFYKKHFLLGCQGKINYLIKWLEDNNFVILKSYEIIEKFSYLFLKVVKYSE